MYLGDERHEHRSLETRKYYSINRGFADISILILATIPLVIMENIILVMLVEVDIGHNIPYTLPLAIGEQSLMLKGEVDIGLRPDTLTPIT